MDLWNFWRIKSLAILTKSPNCIQNLDFYSSMTIIDKLTGTGAFESGLLLTEVICTKIVAVGWILDAHGATVHKY